MIKADLIDVLYERTGLSRQEAAAAIDAILALIKDALQQGERVQMVGFGRFTVRQKQERVGRNPATGEPISIMPRKVVTFTPSRLLRHRANRGEA